MGATKVIQLRSEFFVGAEKRKEADEELAELFEDKEFNLDDYFHDMGFDVCHDYLGNINDLLINSEKLDPESCFIELEFIAPYVKPGSKLQFATVGDGNDLVIWEWFFHNQKVFEIEGEISFNHSHTCCGGKQCQSTITK